MFEIPCPSGLIIQASPLHGRDTIAIAERVGGNASGESVVAFMSSVTKSVIDPGPYPWLEAGATSLPWARALSGDTLVALLRLRVASFPEHKGIFDFEFSCPSCKSLSGASADLEEMLAEPAHLRPLPAKSAKVLLANGTFDTTLPSGAKVYYDLTRLEQDAPMRTLMRRNERKKETDVEVIAKRLKRVDGLEKKGQPVTDLAGLWKWTQGLDANDIDALLAAMAADDIHLDTKILAWCENHEGMCGRQSRIALPLDASFFRPRSATRRAATGKGESSPPSSQESTEDGG